MAERAARLEPMLAPGEMGHGVGVFLRAQRLVVLTARDHDGLLWTSALVGPDGFVEAADPFTVPIATAPADDDPSETAPSSTVRPSVLQRASDQRSLQAWYKW